MNGNLSVSCEDASNSNPLGASNGSAIEVMDLMGNSLPDEIACTVINISGEEVQSITINTGGVVDLYLKDKFGALQLESCKPNDSDLKDCIVAIEYVYSVQNMFTNNAEVVVFERSRGGDLLDLLENVEDDDKMLGGECPGFIIGGSLEITEEDTVDVCLDGSYTTDLTAQAKAEV